MGWLHNLFYRKPTDDSDYLGRFNNAQVVDDMMGDAVQNDAEGKPIETLATSKNGLGSTPQQPQSQQPPQNDKFHTASGQKIIPEIEIVRVEERLSSDMKQLELWATIRNHSAFEIELDKFGIFSYRGDLGKFIGPSGSEQVQIYRGITPTNNAYHTMYVQYKIQETGDYFQADHQIEYKLVNDNSGQHYYVPDELKIIRPVRDI